jgi:hypothetical protein
VLDNFRKRDIPQSPRVQSPYSRLQEALTPVGGDSGKPDAFRVDPPKPNPPIQREESKPSRSDDATTSKLIVGPDIKLKGAEITDCDTLIVEGRVEASMDSRVIQISERGVFAGKAGIDRPKAIAHLRDREGVGQDPLREARDRRRRRDFRRCRGAARSGRQGERAA